MVESRSLTLHLKQKHIHTQVYQKISAYVLDNKRIISHSSPVVVVKLHGRDFLEAI